MEILQSFGKRNLEDLAGCVVKFEPVSLSHHASETNSLQPQRSSS